VEEREKGPKEKGVKKNPLSLEPGGKDPEAECERKSVVGGGGYVKEEKGYTSLKEGKSSFGKKGNQ